MINTNELYDVISLLGNEYNVSFRLKFDKGDIESISIYDNAEPLKEPLYLARTYLLEQEDLKAILEPIVRTWITEQIISKGDCKQC